MSMLPSTVVKQVQIVSTLIVPWFQGDDEHSRIVYFIFTEYILSVKYFKSCLKPLTGYYDCRGIYFKAGDTRKCSGNAIVRMLCGKSDHGSCTTSRHWDNYMQCCKRWYFHLLFIFTRQFRKVNKAVFTSTKIYNWSMRLSCCFFFSQTEIKLWTITDATGMWRGTSTERPGVDLDMWVFHPWMHDPCFAANTLAICSRDDSFQTRRLLACA